MIQPNELRIGNLVINKDLNEISKIVEIGINEARTDSEKWLYLCKYDLLAPIPLTDELITKQCWEKVGYYYTDKNGLEIYETNDGWHLHIDDDKCQTTIAILINSVHELQNAYFIATKKELEIKL